MTFVKIAQNKLNGQPNGDPLMEKDEHVSQLKQEIARLSEIAQFQEAKIARLYAMLTERDSDLSKRERACDEKARLVTASIQKMQEVKMVLEKKTAQTKAEIEQKERQHQEDLQKIAVLEQYGQRMAHALKEAVQKITFLQNALQQNNNTSVVGYKTASAKTTMNEAIPSFTPSQHPGAVSSHSEEKSIDGVADDVSPLGYTPSAEKNMYVRGSPTTSPQDKRLHEMESKLDSVVQELAKMKRKGEEGPHSASSILSAVEGKTPHDANPGQGIFYEELKSFLDFQ